MLVNGYVGARAYPKPPRRPQTTTAAPDADGVIPPYVWQPQRDVDSRMGPDEADDRMERGDADAPPAYRGVDGEVGEGESVLVRSERRDGDGGGVLR